MIEYETQLATLNPMFIRQSLFPDLLFTTSLSAGINEFYPVAVYQANYGRVWYEKLRPVSMCLE